MMHICIQLMEEVNTDKESKETEESVRGCCNSFNKRNREHWEAEWGVRGMLALAESTDWKWCKPKREGVKLIWERDKRASLPGSWFPWEVIYPTFSHFYQLHSWGVEYFILFVFTKHNSTTSSQLYSFPPLRFTSLPTRLFLQELQSAGEGP